MRPKNIRMAPVRSEVVIMDGGLNENVSNIELKGGELIQCKNYYLSEGSQGGYVSTRGLQRFDGQSDIDDTEIVRLQGYIDTITAGETITGGTSSATAVVLGTEEPAQGSVYSGKSMYFDGVQSVVELDSVIDLSTNDFTVQLCFNASASDDTTSVLLGNSSASVSEGVTFGGEEALFGGQEIIWGSSSDQSGIFVYKESSTKYSLIVVETTSFSNKIFNSILSYGTNYRLTVERSGTSRTYTLENLDNGNSYEETATETAYDFLVDILGDVGQSIEAFYKGYIWNVKILDSSGDLALYLPGVESSSSGKMAAYPADATYTNGVTRTVPYTHSDSFGHRSDVYLYMTYGTFEKGEQATTAGGLVEIVEVKENAPTANKQLEYMALAREESKKAIYAVASDYIGSGGTACSGPVLGLHYFDGDLYAFRKRDGANYISLFVSSDVGWVEITGPGGANDMVFDATTSHNFEFVDYNFYATDNVGFGYTMYWVDGFNTAYYYVSGAASYVKINNTGMTGLSPAQADKPTHIAAHNDRLFLSYAGGSLQYSAAGDPTSSGFGAGTSGEIGVGQEITSLQAGVGNSLVIFCDESIYVLNGYVSSDPASDWYVERFSARSGAYTRTVNRMFGTLFFMDDRGVTSIESVDSFGDFQSGSLSQRVWKTLQSNKNLITCATVHRDLNQYRLFFSNGEALYFSFLDRKLRGVTKLEFPTGIVMVTEGEDSNGNVVTFCATSSTDGYVFQMDKGYSFDGADIDTLMKTSFYHYKSPRDWKQFKTVSFEIASTNELTIDYQALFDYESGDVPRSQELEIEVGGESSVWGAGIWGTMVYGGTGTTNKIILPIRGTGSNMSLTLATSEDGKDQHIIQNFITDYTRLRRQL